jgi:hypothetical protein
MPIEDKLADALSELNLIPYLTSDNKQDDGEKLGDVLYRSLSYEQVQSDNSKWWITDSIDSDFQYYIQLINAGYLGDFLRRLRNQKLSVEDIYECRSIMFRSLLGKYTHSGLRRYINTRGRDIAVHRDEIGKNLNTLVEMFNRRAETGEEALVNAVTLLMDFAKVHPFEEGVSRLSRTFANTYLYMHNIRPLRMSDERDRTYRYLTIHSLGDYLGGFVGAVAYAIMSKEEVDAFCNGLADVRTTNLHSIEIKDTILWLAGHKVDYVKDVALLSKAGFESKDASLEKAALWLSWLTKTIDRKLIEKALNGDDDTVRALAIIVAADLDIETYGKKLKELARGDTSESRIAALIVLNEHGLLSKDFVAEELRSEKDERFLTILCMQLKYSPNQKEFLDILKELTDSQYAGVRVGAYYALATHFSETEMLKALCKTEGLQDEVRKVIVEEAVARKEEYGVAVALSESMLKDQLTRRIMLGELTKKATINAAYLDSLEWIATSESYEPLERAYAAYLVGREKGFAHLSEALGMKIEKETPFIISLALASVHEEEKRAKNPFKSELRIVRNYRQNLEFALKLHKEGIAMELSNQNDAYRNLEFKAVFDFVSVNMQGKVKN